MLDNLGDLAEILDVRAVLLGEGSPRPDIQGSDGDLGSKTIGVFLDLVRDLVATELTKFGCGYVHRVGGANREVLVDEGAAATVAAGGGVEYVTYYGQAAAGPSEGMIVRLAGRGPFGRAPAAY
nr:hypothetical protein KPHV_00380 [Kitasatospora purpeofusca]BEK71215.1 hypothetical protein KPHV_84420 [Kitasatospora purpeofusca]